MKKKAEVATRLALVLISVLIASCDSEKEPEENAGVSEQPSAENAAATTVLPEEPTWGRAIVTGDVSHLIAFEEKFKEVLGDSNLEAHLIGCELCDKLSASPPPDNLVYIFPREHEDIFSIFGEAWDATQTSQGDKTFSLLIDGDVPEPDCPAIPAGCRALPPCSDGCGKKGPPVNCGFC